jgi:hypothetical protein
VPKDRDNRDRAGRYGHAARDHRGRRVLREPGGCDRPRARHEHRRRQPRRVAAARVTHPKRYLRWNELVDSLFVATITGLQIPLFDSVRHRPVRGVGPSCRFFEQKLLALSGRNGSVPSAGTGIIRHVRFPGGPGDIPLAGVPRAPGLRAYPCAPSCEARRRSQGRSARQAGPRAAPCSSSVP